VPLLFDVSHASVDAYDECLDAGILQITDRLLTFRHELSRQCLLEAISPGRLSAIHAAVLSALRPQSMSGEYLVRLAHHAEASGNGPAVLEFAPEAARRAADLGAHREAASQYARALRFAGGLPVVEREQLLAAYLAECHLTGNSDDELTTVAALIAIAQANGNRRAEARWMAWLASVLVTSGQNDAAEAASLSALQLLENEPTSTEKLYVNSVQATIRMLHRDGSEAVSWSERTLAMADELDDVPASVRALNAMGSARIVGGDITRGKADLERSLAIAREHELDGDVAGAYTNLGSALGEMYRFDDAEHYLTDGIAFTAERDLDRSGYYMISWLSLTRFYQGRWNETSELANRVLRNPTAIAISRIMALVALGRLRARRGDPEVMIALDEAMELASTTKTLQRLGPVHAARAEAAWLAGRNNLAAEEASAVFDLAIQHGHPWHIGELGFWLWRTGAIDKPPANAAEPFALQIAGDWAGAARCWKALGCPYEIARALADSTDEATLKESLSGYDLLGARPAMLGVTARLRELGVAHIPRGPRSSTRANAAGLTSREVEVLTLLVQGRSNAEIASALFLSAKTVEHHVTAILTKLNVATRREAANRAVEAHLIP
jgi:DNA-binding CsgD family transcriptional regulator/tetratricopeptide (TPR) repeat protein